MHHSHQELNEIGQAVINRFEAVSSSRDRALHDGRQIIRLSANAIRAIHRGELAESEALLDEANAMLSDLTRLLAPLPSIYWQGYVQDAMKEYGEARIVLAMVSGSRIPAPEELGIEDAPWLNGLAEGASELRREVLDALRKGDSGRAEALLIIMDAAYDLLVTVDFPDGMTGGLRRTTDQFRAVLERTRNDFTLTLTQDRLERALREAEAAFSRELEN
jgi:translin